LLAPLAGRIYHHAPQQNARPLGDLRLSGTHRRSGLAHERYIAWRVTVKVEPPEKKKHDPE
jgi:hypothetical protein